MDANNQTGTTDAAAVQQTSEPVVTASSTNQVSTDDPQETSGATQDSAAAPSTAEQEPPMTDTQKDIAKIKQAISALENLGPDFAKDEISALKEKMAALEEKAKQEEQAAEQEVTSLADQFYAKTGIRPWGLLVVVGLYVAVKAAEFIFPWLK